MKSIMTLAIFALVLAAPFAVQNANAQLELGLGAGVNSPTGQYSDLAKTGYSLTGNLGYRVVPLAVVGLDLTYNGNGATDEATSGIGSGYDISTSILQYSAFLKLVFPAWSHNVYAKGSYGYYRGSAKVSGPLGSESLSYTDPGYGIGAGFLINGSRQTSLFADVTYHNVSYEGSDFDTEFFTFTAGALINFDLFKPDTRGDLQDDLDKLRH